MIEFYDHGVQMSERLSPVLNDFGQPLRLNLSEEDKAALEAFLNTFTDTKLVNDPKFADPFQ